MNQFIKRAAMAYINPVRSRSRTLRLSPTPAEAKLWQALRARQVAGAKFRRQHPIATGILNNEKRLYYYADFYCPECKLVIELDGNYHNDKEEYDRARDIRMLEAKYNIMRFSNNELCDMDSVIKRIAAEIHSIRRAKFLEQTEARKEGRKAWI